MPAVPTPRRNYSSWEFRESSLRYPRTPSPMKSSFKSQVREAHVGLVPIRTVTFKGWPISKKTACPKVPSIADPCLVAVGLCTYALDSLVMNRPRNWNFRQGHLHGELPERILHLDRRTDCPLCGGPTPSVSR